MGCPEIGLTKNGRGLGPSEFQWRSGRTWEKSIDNIIMSLDILQTILASVV